MEPTTSTHVIPLPPPMYQHNCENCVFLGDALGLLGVRREDIKNSTNSQLIDLYFCHELDALSIASGIGPVLIARYSEEPGNFSSYPIFLFSNPQFMEACARKSFYLIAAYRRAKELLKLF